MDINFDTLRALDQKPKWFGLGFIQLKMSPTERFHFWHPDLPADDPHYADEWHDHRYDFNSTVLRGAIDTETARPTSIAGGHFAQYHVCCQSGSLKFDGSVMISRESRFRTTAGNSYFLQRDVFHRVSIPLGGKAATFQKRGRDLKDKARVIRQSGRESKNPFESHIEEDRLWEVIRDIMGHETEQPMAAPGYHIAEIDKGVLGQISKIEEEVAELRDAVTQNARVMELVELSDLMGAVEAFLGERHPGYTLDDLRTFAAITRRAFENGHR